MLDVGCGVGGPLRSLARFSGAAVVGLNNNAYQVQRANEINAASGEFARCAVVKARPAAHAAPAAGSGET